MAIPKATHALLKQAIADAEAVRETAVANAKLVLEESITPQIRDMIARRLRVEAEMGGSDDIHEKAKEAPFQDGEPVGSSESPQDTSAIGGTDNKEPSPDAEDTSNIGHGPEANTDSHTDWYDDWSDSDFDLDEVIKELEEDINALQADSLSEKADEEESEEEEGEEGEEAPAKPAHGNKEVPPQFMKKKDETIADPNAPLHPHAGLTPEAADEDEEEGDEEEELDLEAILAELEADEDEDEADTMHQMKKPDADAEKHAMAAKLADLKREVAQYKEALSHVSGRLQEVNMLNAKLLYTNKMFRNQGLTNEQKVRIVEAFDRATTIREVKLVYAALIENLSVAAKTFNASRKKVVAEGLASKATPSTAPKADVIVENTVAKRLQELAGII
jgi:hypothetical protein